LECETPSHLGRCEHNVASFWRDPHALIRVDRPRKMQFLSERLACVRPVKLGLTQ
jgi:hypothetical protein